MSKIGFLGSIAAFSGEEVKIPLVVLVAWILNLLSRSVLKSPAGVANYGVAEMDYLFSEIPTILSLKLGSLVVAFRIVD